MKTPLTLYKSLSPMQLAAVVNFNWQAFPEPDSEQRIFSPKLHREYAEMLARQLEMANYQAGFVVSFRLHASFLSQFKRRTMAYREHEEYRIPVSAIGALNQALVGNIELVSGFTAKGPVANAYYDKPQLKVTLQ